MSLVLKTGFSCQNEFHAVTLYSWTHNESHLKRAQNRIFQLKHLFLPSIGSKRLQVMSSSEYASYSLMIAPTHAMRD